MGLFDPLRNLLKIRAARARLDVTPKPRLGAKIVLGEYRMGVQSGLTDDMWNWLQEQGWREIMFRPERRSYKDVPPSMVTDLFDAGPEDRLRVLKEAVAAATDRAKARAETISRHHG